VKIPEPNNGPATPDDPLEGKFVWNFNLPYALAKSGSYKIVNRKMGKLLDATSNAAATNDVLLKQLAENGTAQQQLTIVRKSDGGFSIRSIGSGKFFRVSLLYRWR
jgi:hypothetical protein